MKRNYWIVGLALSLAAQPVFSAENLKTVYRWNGYLFTGMHGAGVAAEQTDSVKTPPLILSLSKDARIPRRGLLVRQAHHERPFVHHERYLIHPEKRPVHWSQRAISEPILGTIGTGVVGVVAGGLLARGAHDGSAQAGMAMVGGIVGLAGGLTGALVHGALRDTLGTAGGMGASSLGGGVAMLAITLFMTRLGGPWHAYVGAGLSGALAGLVGAGMVEVIRRVRNQ